jgi:hypothetical protein
MRANSRSPGFAICLAAGPEEDLQVGKVYRILPDSKAVAVGCLRVVDESGEDYLYAAKRFVVLDLPKSVRGRLLKAVRSNAGLAGGRTVGIVNSSGGRAAHSGQAFRAALARGRRR